MSEDLSISCLFPASSFPSAAGTVNDGLIAAAAALAVSSFTDPCATDTDPCSRPTIPLQLPPPHTTDLLLTASAEEPVSLDKVSGQQASKQAAIPLAPGMWTPCCLVVPRSLNHTTTSPPAYHPFLLAACCLLWHLPARQAWAMVSAVLSYSSAAGQKCCASVLGQGARLKAQLCEDDSFIGTTTCLPSPTPLDIHAGLACWGTLSEQSIHSHGGGPAPVTLRVQQLIHRSVTTSTLHPVFHSQGPLTSPPARPGQRRSLGGQTRTCSLPSSTTSIRQGGVSLTHALRIEASRWGKLTGECLVSPRPVLSCYVFRAAGGDEWRALHERRGCASSGPGRCGGWGSRSGRSRR